MNKPQTYEQMRDAEAEKFEDDDKSEEMWRDSLSFKKGSDLGYKLGRQHKLSDVTLAELFISKVHEYAEMTPRMYAIPGELMPIFAGRTGYYPLFLIMKEVLKESALASLNPVQEEEG